MKGWNPWFTGLISLVGLLLITLFIYGTAKLFLQIYKFPPSEISQKEENIEKVVEEEIIIPPSQYRIAIVIDDIGQNIDRAKELLDINVPISFAVLPFLTYSTYIAREADIRGRDVLLHLPMEPTGYPEQDPGEGALFISMSDEEILDKFIKSIEAVPHVVGVNNHMGSRFTEDSHKMAIVLEAVKKRGFFFLDSKTSAKTIGYTLARELGLNALDRQVFLDNNQDIEYSLGQFEELIRIAKKRGSAIAIGHPHTTTIAALKKIIGRFEEEGIEVVPVSSLLE